MIKSFNTFMVTDGLCPFVFALTSYYPTKPVSLGQSPISHTRKRPDLMSPSLRTHSECFSAPRSLLGDEPTGPAIRVPCCAEGSCHGPAHDGGAAGPRG